MTRGDAVLYALLRCPKAGYTRLEVAANAGIKKSLIGYCLRALRDEGMVEMFRVGRTIGYRLTTGGKAYLTSLLSSEARRHRKAL